MAGRFGACRARNCVLYQYQRKSRSLLSLITEGEGRRKKRFRAHCGFGFWFLFRPCLRRLAASPPRRLVASLPRCLVASLPRCLVASLPRMPRMPRCLVASYASFQRFALECIPGRFASAFRRGWPKQEPSSRICGKKESCLVASYVSFQRFALECIPRRFASAFRRGMAETRTKLADLRKKRVMPRCLVCLVPTLCVGMHTRTLRVRVPAGHGRNKNQACGFAEKKSHASLPRMSRSNALRWNAYQDASRPRSGGAWPKQEPSLRICGKKSLEMFRKTGYDFCV